MSIEVAAIMVMAMVLASLSWSLPRTLAMDAIAAGTLAVLAVFSVETAAWFVAASALIFCALRLGDKTHLKGPVAITVVILLVASFAFVEFSRGFFWIGISFFTLRLIHVVVEWWLGSITTPSLRDFLRYLFFLPVMLVGPIHRLTNFQRQVDRRRFDAGDFLTGLERCLVGAFMAYFLGEVCVGHIRSVAANRIAVDGVFFAIWLLSALDWVKLFFVFAGLSAIALGASLMAGLKLEENFNRPWTAVSLVDFWTRWHITLTEWSRDYAYRPVMAITRSPVVGVIAAMLVIGLWHEVSVYYVLWSFWQAFGIVASRWVSGWAATRLPPISIPDPIRQTLVFVGILGWLSAARPVIGTFLEHANDTIIPAF